VKQRVLVVAPHPDDEVLGAGGTMARLASEGAEVFVAIVTRGYPPHCDAELVEVGRNEARVAHGILGVRETFFLEFPAAALDTVAHRDVNAALGGTFREVRPDTVFFPFSGDIHLDHQLVSLSTLVAARPTAPGFPRAVYAYETLSETNWNAPYLSPAFAPNTFYDISAHLERKIEAMQAFASQLRPAPHERSAETLRALATVRGSTIGVHAAEAFVAVRRVV
jgi:LmbE family N-acetylglucosaminyl deacetylase